MHLSTDDLHTQGPNGPREAQIRLAFPRINIAVQGRAGEGRAPSLLKLWRQHLLVTKRWGFVEACSC